LYHATAYGSQAVMVFFVLSGFWIARSVDMLKDQPDFWRIYLVRRLSRLLAVLVPALVIGLAIDLIGLHVLHALVYDGPSAVAWGAWAPVAEAIRPKVFIGNLLFLQDIATAPLGSNAALWSLSYEFWFYLAYPALLFALRGRLTLALGSLAVFALAPQAMAENFAVWLLGVVLYHVEVRLGSPARARGLWLIVPVVTFGAALYASGNPGISDVAASLVPGIATLFLLLVLLRAAPPLPRWGQWSARCGANGSYSLYLSHMPITILAGAIADKAGLADSLTLRWAIVALAFGWAALFAWTFETRTEALRQQAMKITQGLWQKARQSALLDRL